VSNLLRKYIRTILESEDRNARVPNQLISKNGSKKDDEKKDETDESSIEERGMKGACWKGYTAYGMKTKNGREVPNCVPNKKKNEISEFDEAEGDNVKEFSSVGSGAIAGMTLPLGMAPGDALPAKTKKKNRKRTYS